MNDKTKPATVVRRKPTPRPMQDHITRRVSREVADHMRRFFRTSAAHFKGPGHE